MQLFTHYYIRHQSVGWRRTRSCESKVPALPIALVPSLVKNLHVTCCVVTFSFFRSRTDTFGVVLIEAGAFGAPVAAFFVTGPVQSTDNGGTGILEGDLDLAVQSALMVNARIVS